VAGGRVAHRRPRGDDGRVVAGHVGDHQRHEAGRVGGGGQPAALDRREVLSDAVHLVDRGAGPEQRLVDRLLVVEGEPRCRQGEQRRAAARDQGEHEVVGTEALDEVEDAPGRSLARGVGHRMCRLDDLDPPAGHGVIVAGHDQPREVALPMRLDGGGHGGTGLAGADHDGPAPGRLRQVCRYAAGRHGGRHRGVEHPPQQGFGRHLDHGLPPPTPTARKRKSRDTARLLQRASGAGLSPGAP
jgi:hypothetical protein